MSNEEKRLYDDIKGIVEREIASAGGSYEDFLGHLKDNAANGDRMAQIVYGICHSINDKDILAGHWDPDAK